MLEFRPESDQNWEVRHERIWVYEAKTHLTRLIEKVERGETITITRHGKPVAHLVPVEGPQRSRADSIAAIKEFGKKHSLGGISIRDLINEGRKY